MSKRRNFVFNNKFYTKIDSTGRLHIPKVFISPDNWNVYRGYYMGENKIYFKPDNNSFFKNNAMRFTVPYTIRKMLDVKPNDIFEIICDGAGFIVIKIDDKSIFTNTEEET